MRGVGGLLGIVAAALGGCSVANEAGPAVAVDPAALYAQMCARCHGPDGKGVAAVREAMPTLRDLTDPVLRAQLRNEDMERVIMAGKNQMPAFGGTLSMPKIQAVTGYVRRLGGR